MMLCFKREGKRLKQGLNVYSLLDKHSFGFVFLLGRWVFRMRYSKNAECWFVGRYKAEML